MDEAKMNRMVKMSGIVAMAIFLTFIGSGLLFTSLNQHPTSGDPTLENSQYAEQARVPKKKRVSIDSDESSSGGITNNGVDVDGLAALVPWEDYDSSVKATIDRMASQGDCAGLEQQWWNATNNSQVVLEQTGHSNGELMRYISGLRESIGCY